MSWLLVFHVAITAAQDIQNVMVVEEVFQLLEEKHKVTFNYSSETVDGIRVKPIDPSMSFEEALQFIENQSALQFTVLDNSFVSVERINEFTICGYLKDRKTQESLVTATVEGRANATVTGPEGYFELIITDKNEEITLRYLGYETQRVIANTFTSSPCATLYLDQQSEDLDEVILTSYLVQGMSKLNNGALQIDFNTFTALPGLIETDVLQATQALPGIQSSNETVSNINIRGGTNDQNLVLWDDIKMYQTGHFFGLISAFNPQITQRVKVQKSGTSAEYTDGVSGSIRMETDTEVTKDFSLNAGVNLIDTNVLLDIPLGAASSLQIGGRKSLNDLVDTPTYTSYFERITQDTEVASNTGPVINTNRDFDFYDTSLRWLYKISDSDVLRVNFLYINNRLEFNENATLDGTLSSRESSVSQNSLGAGIYYQRKWNETFSTTFQLYETDYQLRAINANVLEEQRFLQENVVSESGLKVITDLATRTSQTLQLGYELIETKVTNLDDVDVPLFRNLIAEVVRTHSGFGQYMIQTANGRGTLVAGLRYNYLDKFNTSIFEPRLTYTQQLGSYWGIEVAGEYKHQITSQVVNFQNDFLGIEKRRWQLSNNTTIPILKSRQFSAGVNYDRKGWLFNLEGYYKNVSGITAQEQGFQNQYEFTKSIGEYDVIGADVLLRKRWTALSCWLSYSFMDNQYSFESLSPSTFPSNFDIPHSVTFGTTYVHRRLKLSGGINWRSGNPTTEPVVDNEIVDGDVNFGSPNNSRFADYLRVDASALYQVDLGNSSLEAGVSVWNVLNQRNIIGKFYRVRDGVLIENEQEALGLTPNAMVRFTL